MGNSFFHFKQFSILSQEKGLKVNTDACLLGALAQSPQTERILDIGCGTGVITLMMAQRFPMAEVFSVELLPEIYNQARLNVDASPFKKRIHLQLSDYLKFKTADKFDLIVCNPPYFTNHLQKKSGSKNNALHNIDLPALEFITKLKQDIRLKGLIYLIYPPFEASTITAMAKAEGLFLQKEIHIYNKPNKPYRNILCFCLSSETAFETEEFLMHEENGNKTEAFRLLMHDFYLENTENFKRQRK